jgi:NAD+ kinase
VRLGFVVHPARDAAVRAAADLVAWCRERGAATRVLEGPDVGAAESADDAGFPDGLDLVVSVGGDGTLLRAALMGNRAGVPVLGVKVGRLGFLTEVDPDAAPSLLDAWMSGRGRIDERMALVAEAEGASWTDPQWALNEVIVEKRARHRVVRLATSVNEDHVTTFSADGVIVASPIVSPRLPCLVLTPVSAHMVFDRAIVLAPDERVTLEVREEEPGLLSADGRPGLELPVGARVTIRRSDRPARLLRGEVTESFYSLLRRKFSLPADPGG